MSTSHKQAASASQGGTPKQQPAGHQDATPGRLSLRTIALAATLTLAVLFSAASLTLSPELQQHHNSDSVLHSLISTQQWTPYYWGQDRLGMFFALVAMPVADPFHNLLVQNFLFLLFAFAGFILLGVCLAGRRVGLLVGLVTSLMFVALTGTEAAANLFLMHPETFPSVPIGLAGILLMPRGATTWRHVVRSWWRLALALAAFLVALWINVTLVIILVPLALVPTLEELARGRDRDSPESEPGWDTPLERLLRRKGALAGLALLAFALLVNYAAASAVDLSTTTFQLEPVARWPSAWVRLVLNAGSTFAGSGLWVTLLLLAAAATVCVHKASPAQLKSALVRLGVSIAAALVYLFLAGASEHVRINGYGARYSFLPVLLLVSGIVSFLATVALEHHSRRTRSGSALFLAALLVVGTLVKFGPPSYQGVQQTFAAKWGPPARDVLELDCTHVWGDYWNVWVTVYYANLLAHRSGEERQVYGVAFRAGPTRPLWAEMPRRRLRFARFRSDDVEVYGWLFSAYHVPRFDPVPVETTPLIAVHRVR